LPSHAPAMLSAGPRMLNNSTTSSQISPHPHWHQWHEVVLVFNTITEILDASKIIRRDHDERGCSSLPIATLEKVFAFSESLWEKVKPLPLSSVPSLHKHLIKYGLILVDIQHILSSSDPLEIDSLAIGFRLDDFLLQFQEALDLLKGPADQLSTQNSILAYFFPYSHHINIYGGIFSAGGTSNSVVYDPVVREQSRKILQVLYVQCVVLFS